MPPRWVQTRVTPSWRTERVATAPIQPRVISRPTSPLTRAAVPRPVTSCRLQVRNASAQAMLPSRSSALSTSAAATALVMPHFE